MGGETQLTVAGNYSNETAVEIGDLQLESDDETVVNVSETGTVTAIGEGTTNITATIDDTTESITITVTEAVVDEDGLTVSAADAELIAGDQTQLNVSGNYTDGTSVEISDLALTSNDTSVATVDENGLVAGIDVGQAEITATIGETQQTFTINVTEAVVDENGFVVSLDENELAEGETTQLTVSGTYTNGTAVTVADAKLSSADETVGTVDTDGVVTTAGVGQVTLAATVDDVTETVTLTVTEAVVDSDGLTVSIDADELIDGQSTQLTVSGTYTNGTAITADHALLSADDTTIATVAPDGTITAVGDGQTTITVAVGDEVQTIAITVTEAVVDSDGLTVSVDDVELAVGETAQLTLAGTYTNGTAVELADADLFSDDETVATIAANGTVTAVGDGQTTISVVVGDEQESVVLTVTEAVVDGNGLTTTLGTAELAVGQQTTLTVVGNFTNGTAVSVTDATLTANTSDVVDSEPDGTITAVGEGTALLTVTVGDVFATVSVTVTEARTVEDGLTVTVSDDTIAEGESTQANVTAVFTDGSQTTVTNTATLTSTNEDVLTVAENGTVTAVGTGEAAIEAEVDGESATVDITVTDAEIVDGGLTISLDNTTVADGENTAATVTALLTNGSTLTVTDEATFISTNESVATVDENGTVTVVGTGTTEIEATYGGESTTTTLTAGQAALVDGGLSIDAPTTELIGGGTAEMKVTAQYTNGSTLEVTNSTTLSSSETAVLTVDNGTVTAVGEGNATLTATFGGESATIEMTVFPGRLAFETNASADTSRVDVGSNVTFRPGTVNETQLPGENHTSQWNWEWNDGETIETATQNTLTRSFAEPATVNVTYTVQSGGVELTDRFTVTVVDREDPVARLSVAETAEAGDPITFDGSASTDNVEIASYEWDFGNGTTVSGTALDMPTGQYETPGEYTVSLTVTDTSGNTETATSTVLVTGALASVDDDGLVFGDVGTNATDTASVSITNNGPSVLTVSSAAVTGPNATAFAVATDVPFVVRPGETRPLAVSFTPTKTGQLNATLNIETNSTGDDTFSLDLSGQGTTSDLQPDNGSVSSGKIDVGSQTATPVSITNTGGADATLTEVRLRGSGTDQFRLADGWPSTIEQDSSDELLVIFEPQWVGEHRVTLEIETADGQTTQVSIVGTGEGPVLSVPNTERSFEPTGINSATDTTLTVSNYGTQPLNLTDISITGEDAENFSVETAPSTIVPGEKAELEVSFEADHAGSYEAILELTSNDPTTGTTAVDLTATAVAAKIGVDRTTVNFGETVVGSPEYLNITVRNQASSLADLNIESTQIVGTNPDDFSVESGDAPFVLTPGETNDIRLNFTALAVGERDAQFQIRSDAGNQPLINVWLSNTQSYILVQEVSNPTVNVEGNNLVAGKDYVINVATPAMDQSTVTFDDLQMTMQRDGDFEMDIVNSETHADTEFVDNETDILQYVQIDHLNHDSATTFDNTGLAYRVAIDAVDDGVDPTDVKLHRYNTTLDEWETLDVTFVGQSSTHYQYEVETPGFSEFVITAPGETTDPTDPTDTGSPSSSGGSSTDGSGEEVVEESVEPDTVDDSEIEESIDSESGSTDGDQTASTNADTSQSARTILGITLTPELLVGFGGLSVLTTALGALFMLGRQRSERYLIAIGSDVDEWSALVTSVALDEREARTLGDSVDIVAVSTDVEPSLTDSQQRALTATTITKPVAPAAISLDELRASGCDQLVWLGDPPAGLDESTNIVQWPLPEADAEASETELVDQTLRQHVSTLFDQFE